MIDNEGYFYKELANGNIIEGHSTVAYAALRERAEAGQGWRQAALSLGESWGRQGPSGYYDMTPEQWLEWMNEMLTEWLVYLSRRREALIIELRALDRLLGRTQTIPERTR